jgi:Domain of unknown function (DUF1413)
LTTQIVSLNIVVNNIVNIVVNNLSGEIKMVDQLLAEALEETKNLEKSEVFLVKDLFKGYVWKRYGINERILLGTLFLNEIKKRSTEIEILDKTSSNQQKYMKL